MDLSNISLSYAISIVLTLIALLGSTIYTVRNILRIWRKGEPKPEPTDEAEDEDETDQADDDTVINQQKQPLSNTSTGEMNLDDIDPVEYCEHIQSEVKKAKQRVTTKKIKEKLTKEQIQEEQDIQCQQLQSIFKLMQAQSEKFGIDSMDDVQQQMKLYG